MKSNDNKKLQDKNLLHCLLKVGAREHIEDFRNKGILYMNPLNFFREMEEDKQRKDIHEGLERIQQIDQLKIMWEDKIIELSKTAKENTLKNAQLRVRNNGLTGNIFCMIGITSDFLKKNDGIDGRNAEFGNSFLLIHNPRQFLDKVRGAIEKLKLKFTWNMVQYYDENSYTGNLGPFYKPRNFEHQSEFRILIQSDGKYPLILNTGSLEDISDIYDIDQLEELRFSRK